MLCLKPMVTWLSGLSMRQPRPTKLKAQLQTAWIVCIGNLRGLNCNISSNNNSRPSSILPKPHQPTDLMKKIAAVAMAQPVYMRYEAAVTGQSPAHLKEARLLAAAEHRAKLGQLQPVARADAANSPAVQQQNTSFAPAASPNAASALADSLSSADLQVDEVIMKYL